MIITNAKKIILEKFFLCKKIPDNALYVILFLTAVLSKSRTLFVYHYPWVGDSILTIAGGMWFAGYDWSNFAAHGSYYGFLYPMLLSPLMRVIDNPELLYRCMLLVNNVMFGLIAIGVFHIGYKKCKISAAPSMAATLLFIWFGPISVFSDFIMSEVPYTLWIIAVVIFLCNLTEARGKQRYVETLILSIVIPLGLMIHSRFLIIATISVFLLVIYHIIYKKALVNYGVMICVTGMEIFFVKMLVSYVQRNVWKTNTGDAATLTNSTEQVAGRITYIQRLFADGNLKIFVETMLSNISTYVYLSGGVFVLAAITVFLLIRHHLVDIIKNKKLFIVFIMGVFSWSAMIFCQCLVSFEGIAMGTNLKWLIYTRYASPFLFLIYICMAYYIDKYAINIKRISFWVVLLSLISAKWYLWILLDKLGEKEVGDSMMFKKLMLPADDYTHVTVMKNSYLFESILAFTVITVISCLILYKNKLRIYVLFLCLCSLGFYIRVSDYWILLCDRQYNGVKASVDIARELTSYDSDYNLIVLGDGEYLPEMRYGLYNRDFEIVKTIDELPLINDEIVFSNRQYDELPDGYWVTIEDGQYVYTRSERNYVIIMDIVGK